MRGRIGIAGRLVDGEAVAVARADRVQPCVQPLKLGWGEAAARIGEIENIVGALDDRLVDRAQAWIMVRGEAAGRRSASAHDEAESDDRSEIRKA